MNQRPEHHAIILAGRFAYARNKRAIELIRNRLGEPGRPFADESLDSHPDFTLIQANEKGVIPIDVIRELSRRLTLKPSQSAQHCVWIDEAHRMNVSAQNGLLKTLEDPPAPSFFILSTDRYRLLLPTIRSRAVREVVCREDATDSEEKSERVGEGADAATLEILHKWVGDDIARINDMLNSEVWRACLSDTKDALLSGGAAALQAAEKYAPDYFDWALGCIEVHLVELMRQGNSSRFLPAVDELQLIRARGVFRPNRQLALERILLAPQVGL